MAQLSRKYQTFKWKNANRISPFPSGSTPIVNSHLLRYSVVIGCGITTQHAQEL